MDRGQKNQVMAIWRSLAVSDIDGLMRVADEVHASLPETDQVFAERIKLYPEGCLALVQNDCICGYAISHPIRQGQLPALDSMLGEIAPDADQYYIHDVAISPELRGQRFADEVIGKLLDIAKRYSSTCLVSVYGTETFWDRFGFTAAAVDEAMSQRLRDYGENAKYLSRSNHEDGSTS